jgi:threonine dehydratase
MEAQPDIDVMLVPVGAGSGVCGALVAGKAIKPDLRVIGVQAAGAPVVADSWRDRTLHTYDQMSTFAEGLATRVAFEYPARIMWDRIDGFRLVSDDEMKAAMIALMENAWIVAEGAGAAATAALFNMRDELAGKTVCSVVSGGNVPLSGLRDALAQGDGQ